MDARGRGAAEEIRDGRGNALELLKARQQRQRIGSGGGLYVRFQSVGPSWWIYGIDIDVEWLWWQMGRWRVEDGMWM